MQIDGKQIKPRSIDFNSVIKTGVDETIILGDTTVTIDKEPENFNDIVNKGYVDALSNASNYIEPCDYICETPINSFSKREFGKLVLCINAGSPGVYTYNGTSFVQYSVWTNIASTTPNAGIVPVKENGLVYIFKIDTNSNVIFTKLPQDTVSYQFGFGLKSENGTIVVDTLNIASVDALNSVKNVLNTFKSNPLVNTQSENGITINGNKIGIALSNPLYSENNELKIKVADQNNYGVMSPSDYMLLRTITTGDAKDWNENDPSNSRYIHNRPFYKEDVVINDDQRTIPSRGFYTISDTVLEAGTIYAISINNEIPLEAECRISNENNQKVIDFGNNIIVTEEENSTNAIVRNNTSNSITFTKLLDKTNGEVHKIDPIYLPGSATGCDENSFVFQNNLFTTKEIGNYKPTSENPMIEIPTAGKTFKQVWDEMFLSEQNPTITQPYVNLTTSGFTENEVGNTYALSFSGSLSAGNYQYGPETGVTPSTVNVSNTMTTEEFNSYTGTLDQAIMGDDQNSLTMTITHSVGAIPKTNMGNDYTAGQIQAGTKSKTVNFGKGYRNMFVGYTNTTTMSSSVIRSLVGGTIAKAQKKKLAIIEEDTTKSAIVIAVPKSLNASIHVEMPSSSYAEVTTDFIKVADVDVEGYNNYTAVAYDVWVYNPATMDGTYEITII